MRFADGRPERGWRYDGSFSLPTEPQLIAFVVHLADTRNASPSVIRRRLRGVGQWFHEALGSDPRFDHHQRQLPQLNAVVKGIVRKRSKRKKRRDPITADKLKLFSDSLDRWQQYGAADTRMLKACMWLAMTGLLRAGEVTVKTLAGYDSEVNANRSDLQLIRDADGHLSHLEFFLRQSKCDQEGKGITVPVYAARSPEYCTVRMAEAYLQGSEHLDPDGPLFVFQSGRALTHSKLNQILQQLARRCGCVPKHTTTHSLRQGGAVTLFSLGYSAEHVKKAGRWVSSAFETYLSIPSSIRQRMANEIVGARDLADVDGVRCHATWTSLYDRMVAAG